MKCPVCGTNGIEGNVCFYCEAKKERLKKKKGKSGGGDSPDKAPPKKT